MQFRGGENKYEACLLAEDQLTPFLAAVNLFAQAILASNAGNVWRVDELLFDFNKCDVAQQVRHILLTLSMCQVFFFYMACQTLADRLPPDILKERVDVFRRRRTKIDVVGVFIHIHYQ